MALRWQMVQHCLTAPPFYIMCVFFPNEMRFVEILDRDGPQTRWPPSLVRSSHSMHRQ